MKKAILFESLPELSVRCNLCAHHCRIANHQRGLCKIRENIDGTLYTHSYGKLIAAHVDPIEKKPLYHFHPGSSAFSVATIGCNFQCEFCQNWQISQVNEHHPYPEEKADPQSIVFTALDEEVKSVCYTYTEPTIFAEYMIDTASFAKKNGLKNVMVSNGYQSSEALDMILPLMDGANIDLKGFSDHFYRKYCLASLRPVLDNLRRIHESDVWLEITTLFIPGLNDDEQSVDQFIDYILSLSPHIPWHISRYFPNYKMEIEATDISFLISVRDRALEKGLNYVYIGNVVNSQCTSTYCPNCNHMLIVRNGYSVSEPNIIGNKCGECGFEIAGLF